MRPAPDVTLAAPDSAGLEVIAGWLADPSNARWLDFGGGLPWPTRAAVTVMARRPSHLLRLFRCENEPTPIGVVVLSQINPSFGTATLWYVLGAKAYAGRGLTTRAVAHVLATAFRELKLAAVNAWAVETNHASIGVLRRNGFRLIGRQRRCHVIDDQRQDRLLFDLLAEEYDAGALAA